MTDKSLVRREKRTMSYYRNRIQQLNESLLAGIQRERVLREENEKIKEQLARSRKVIKKLKEKK